MKSAVTADGKPVLADQQAPETAECPHCGCPVTLRRRRQMSGETTYFWRHIHGFTLSCRNRSSPVNRRNFNNDK